MVDTSTALFSRFSWHNIPNDDAKIKKKLQIAKKKYTKRTVPFVYISSGNLFRSLVSFQRILAGRLSRQLDKGTAEGGDGGKTTLLGNIV